jgi:UDP-3-O-[3-hydroxymyristoyl] glucosamine N-acyltransferase
MKLSKIAEILDEKFYGQDIEITSLGSLDSDFQNEIIYIENNKYLDQIKHKNPSALIVPHGLNTNGIPYIEVNDPKSAFVKLLQIFNPSKNKSANGINKNAYVDQGAKIGENATIMQGAVIMEGTIVGQDCIIYPNCVVENDCIIGSNTILYSGVIIRERCIIGNHCILHSGSVIGADGFRFYEKDGEIIKIPHIGIVTIGDCVEIGANCTIDRATIDKTEIGKHTKLDNMVHVAHNVKIGEKCIIAAQAGISGSVVIGNHVYILGQAGIADHVHIADNTIIMPQSGIPSDIKNAQTFFGTPARPVKEHHRIFAAMKYLPDLLRRVKILENTINKK